MVKLIILLLCWGLGGFRCPRAPPCGQILCSLAVKILAVATQVPKGAEFESLWWRKCFCVFFGFRPGRPEQNHVRARADAHKATGLGELLLGGAKSV